MGNYLKIPKLLIVHYSLLIVTGLRTVFGGEFVWGGRLLKSNGGAQWLACVGWKSTWTCIRISQPDCKTYKSSRHESG